jgi:hypothetical protein
VKRLRFIELTSLVLLLSVVAVATPAFAQGKSLGKGRGAKAPAPAPQSDLAQAPTIPGTGIRNFGVWLDDASFLPKGKGWATFGIGYWRTMFGHQWDLPSMDAGWTLDRRIQISMATPISRATYDDGTVDRGVGDTYISAKIGLVDPDAGGRNYGFAIAPVVEILSSGSFMEGDSRFHWAIPVTAERRFDSFRIYGAAGYFSRGSVFGAGAVEVPVSDRVVVTGTLSHSRSLEDDPLADALELSKSRYDVSGGAMYVLAPTVTLFGSLGRTVSQQDANAASLAMSAGVSFGFNTVQTRRKPQN